MLTCANTSTCIKLGADKLYKFKRSTLCTVKRSHVQNAAKSCSKMAITIQMSMYCSC